MEEITDKIWELILKDIQGELTEEESRELAEWRASSGLNEHLYEMGVDRENARDLGFLWQPETEKEEPGVGTIIRSGERPARFFGPSRKFMSMVAALKAFLRR